jgi:rubrerythrin
MAKNTIISGCMKVERSALYVYKKLMKKFPDKREFWRELVDDEVAHLSFLNDVQSLGLANVMQKTDSLPTVESINDALKIADDLIAKIKKDTISLKKALAMILKLEETIVETYTNRLIAKLISCEDEVSYKKIVADEKRHVNKIKKMMK